MAAFVIQYSFAKEDVLEETVETETLDEALIEAEVKTSRPYFRLATPSGGYILVRSETIRYCRIVPAEAEP